MFNVNVNINDESVSIIQARIIELTDRKINLDSQLREVMNRMDLENREYTLNELNRSRKVLIGKLIECEKILHLNKQLLNRTNEHEYQLEN